MVAAAGMIVLLSTETSASMLYLKNGKAFNGDLLEQNNEFVKIKVAGVELTFYEDEIDHLELGERAEAPGIRIDKRFLYRVTKTFTMQVLGDIETIQYQYPLVRNDIPFQTVSHIQTTPQASAIVDDPDDNKLAVFYFANKKAGQTIDINLSYDVEVDRPEILIEPEKIPDQYGPLGSEVLAALGPKSDNHQVAQLARDIVGELTNPYLKAQAIYDYLVSYLTYDNIDGQSGFQSIQDTLISRRGNCTDITKLFLALAQLNGIPARQVDGTVFQPNVAVDKSESNAGHAWAEIYLPVYGWMPVDVTFGLTDKKRFFCFLYDIHLRECYGQVISKDAGSLYRGSSIEIRTTQRYDQIPLKRDARISVELLKTEGD